MIDCQYKNLESSTSEIKHKYGSNIHILSDAYLLTLLSRLCSKNTIQPEINRFITMIYENLIRIVLSNEFPKAHTSVETRMIQYNPEAVFEGELLSPHKKTVVVSMARAGILPSYVVYDTLNYIIDPKIIRQDHFTLNRSTDNTGKVVGCNISGYKIGGGIDNVFLLIPDPMGATGVSIKEVLKIYREKISGNPQKIIAIHLIITPEYIRKIQTELPELIVYACRLDRGLSSKEILNTIPGTYLQEERGLNKNDYIVPGGGGFGEILNNSYV